MILLFIIVRQGSGQFRTEKGNKVSIELITFWFL